MNHYYRSSQNRSFSTKKKLARHTYIANQRRLRTRNEQSVGRSFLSLSLYVRRRWLAVPRQPTAPFWVPFVYGKQIFTHQIIVKMCERRRKSYPLPSSVASHHIAAAAKQVVNTFFSQWLPLSTFNDNNDGDTRGPTGGTESISSFGLEQTNDVQLL